VDDDVNDDGGGGDDTCESFTTDGKAKCKNALDNTCRWKKPKYGFCEAIPNIFNSYDCTANSNQKKCKQKGKAKGFCKWKGQKKACVHKCDALMKKENACLKAKKNQKKLCTYDATAVVPGTGCIPK